MFDAAVGSAEVTVDALEGGGDAVAGGKQVVEADVPMMSLFGYCTDLRSMTGGRGEFSYEFARYEQAPSDVQEKEVAARAAKVAEGNEE